MWNAIGKGIALAAPTLVVTVVGSIGVAAGKEMGEALGKWAAARIWGPRAAPKT